MPYHDFEVGETYSLEYIVSELKKFLEEDRYDDIDGKEDYLKKIETSGADEAVWTPFAEAGWGASPINHRAWKRPDGTDLRRDT